ncbi:MAG: hypothetical protein J6T15_04890 [Bacilli bacterium]|nr:hypothetical protein [Bacilli bacterium]
MSNDSWKDCKFDFRSIPTKCDNCGSDRVRYTTNDEIYGKIYGNGGCYICDSCRSYVGVYDTKSKKPLGRLATKELRELKMACHSKLDPWWKSGKFKRTDCYGYLANKLGLHLRETHFGWFDKEYLDKSLIILGTTTEDDIRKYVNSRKEINNG